MSVLLDSEEKSYLNGSPLLSYQCLRNSLNNIKTMNTILLLSVLAIIFVGAATADKPCNVREISGESLICVCNSTYCDDIVREAPASGSFVAYTTSEAGSRFKKSTGLLKLSSSSECCKSTLTLDVDSRFQAIEGFGGAVTDSAGINWKSLSPAVQDYMIQSYYGTNGIEYNMLRVPIGGTDSSTHPYAYNELPENDFKLTNFTLVYEDYEYKLPMIKATMKQSQTDVHVVASTWSPPKWMKTSKAWSGFSRLAGDFYQTYADYHLKFLEKYAEEGVGVWALTTTNEPVNGVIPLIRLNSLGWSPEKMGNWLVKNLGPTIRNSTFKDVKILAMDDQRYNIPLWFNVMVSKIPEVLDYIDGVAFHYYGNMISPPTVLDDLHKSHPDKIIMPTESCQGAYPWNLKKVILGSWKRAKNYILDIIADLNHYSAGYIDWNMCLNSQGGPVWTGNFVDAPVIVYPETDEFIKQPMFYAIGHFSKFLPRGSFRIGVTEKKALLQSSIDNVAFVTTRGTVAVVMYNGGGVRQVAVQLGDQQAEIELEAKSITTLEIPYAE